MINCTKLDPVVFKDSRGSILSFNPPDPIVEYNLMITNKGESRGYHYHPHFNEYFIIVSGECEFLEFDSHGNHTSYTLTQGDSVLIPKDIPHAFTAITELVFVSMLTRKWTDSTPPIVTISQ